MLTALGISPDAMQILVVKDARQGTGHAVLRVTIGGTGFLLDNQSHDVGPEDWQSWYKPLYAVATTGKWIYGTVPVRLAAATPNTARSGRQNPGVPARAVLTRIATYKHELKNTGQAGPRDRATCPRP